MSTEIENLRNRFMTEGLQYDGLAPNPVDQFQLWYSQAMASGIPEPNAMSLATVADNGQPWLRTVLLKTYDDNGFVFFTNYESNKARHIAVNPRVALLFPWIALGRQVKITGSAVKIPLTESMQYFASRPRGSQIGAWASPQSEVITSRSLLLTKFDEMKRKFSAGKVPLPSFWGGYRVTPDTIEFWQAGEHRLHDRFIYRQDREKNWHIERLAP
jgi:pyridoxamine 5'-phosphate oxidase